MIINLIIYFQTLESETLVFINSTHSSIQQQSPANEVIP